MNSEKPNVVVDAVMSTERSLDPLEAIRQLRRAQEYIDIKIEEAVREARMTSRAQGSYFDHVTESGGGVVTRQTVRMGVASWQQIADALHVSRQSAHKRYKHLLDP